MKTSEKLNDLLWDMFKSDKEFPSVILEERFTDLIEEVKSMEESADWRPDE